jgi:putative PIN family toxin of toxin-antitoxin system
MIRVVLDTNILVSALLQPDGQPPAVFLLALSGGIQLCVSEPIQAEYDEVIRRPRFKLGAKVIENALESIRQVGEWLRPAVTVQARSDPDDDIFLECAEVARADYLVTGNARDFPSECKGTRIVTAREFLEIIASIQSGDRG